MYALAAIVYRAVTGFPAFTGKDIAPTIYDVVYRVPNMPSSLAPLGEDVDRVLAIGLAKNPSERFDTAAELANWFAVATTSSGLTAAQRRRADDLIARAPWGTMLRGPSENV